MCLEHTSFVNYQVYFIWSWVPDEIEGPWPIAFLYFLNTLSKSNGTLKCMWVCIFLCSTWPSLRLHQHLPPPAWPFSWRETSPSARCTQSCHVIDTFFLSSLRSWHGHSQPHQLLPHSVSWPHFSSAQIFSFISCSSCWWCDLCLTIRMHECIYILLLKHLIRFEQ